MTELFYREFQLGNRSIAVALDLHSAFLLGIFAQRQMSRTLAAWTEWQIWLGPFCAEINVYPRGRG